MGITLNWGFDPSTAITQFVLTKSTDKGKSYSALTTIAFDVTGAAFDAKKGLFFYTDAAGAPGHIYKLVAQGAAGDSSPSYIVAPADEPTTCLVIGYIRDGFGAVNENVKVNVSSYGNAQESWADNPNGLIAQNPRSLGIVAGERTVYPDSNGMWQVELIKNTRARIIIEEMNFDWTFKVPNDSGPVNITDIPQLRGQEFHGARADVRGNEPPPVRG